MKKRLEESIASGVQCRRYRKAALEMFTLLIMANLKAGRHSLAGTMSDLLRHESSDFYLHWNAASREGARKSYLTLVGPATEEARRRLAIQLSWTPKGIAESARAENAARAQNELDPKKLNLYPYLRSLLKEVRRALHDCSLRVPGGDSSIACTIRDVDGAVKATLEREEMQ